MSWSHMPCVFYLCESIKVMIDKPSGRRRMCARQSTRLPASDARLLNTREENADVVLRRAQEGGLLTPFLATQLPGTKCKRVNEFSVSHATIQEDMEMNTIITTLRTVVFAVIIGAPLSSSALGGSRGEGPPAATVKREID